MQLNEKSSEKFLSTMCADALMTQRRRHTGLNVSKHAMIDVLEDGRQKSRFETFRIDSKII